MHPSRFRLDADEATFRQHARDNYIVGTPISPDGIFHPYWVHEAATMNLEAYELARAIYEAAIRQNPYQDEEE